MLRAASYGRYSRRVSTPVLRVLDRHAADDELAAAGRILREGGIVAFPTETVYGLAASAEHPEAVKRLYKLKGRSHEQAMTVMVSDLDAVRSRVASIPPRAADLMQRFWPGPLTLVLDADADTADTPQSVAGTIGFRLPSHPLARGLVQAAGVPLLVPSANRAGEPPATSAEEVLRIFKGELDLVIDSGPSKGGVASTVVRVQGDDVTVLREGAIPEWRIERPGDAHIVFVCTGNTDRSPLAVAILKRRLAERLGIAESDLAEAGFVIESAGLAAEPDRRASRHAREVARQLFHPPLDLEAHRSRKLDTPMVKAATRIICMERDHRDQILAFFPHRERDVLLLDPEGQDVSDPVGRSLATYERLARRLDAAASLIVGGLVGRR